MTSLPPAGTARVSDTVIRDSRTGTDVPVRVTLPEGDAKQVLVFRSGMDVKTTDVDEFAKRLADHGIATYEMESPNTLRPSFSNHASEIDAVFDHARGVHPAAGFAVGGESFGADAALYWNAVFNEDRTPILALPASIFTKPEVLGVKELGKVFGSIVSDRLEAELIPTPLAKGSALTSNPQSRLYVDPATGTPVDPDARQPIGNFRDSALLALGGLAQRLNPFGDAKPGHVRFVMGEQDHDVYNGATKAYAALYPDTSNQMIEGGHHALTQEWHLGITDAVAGWMAQAAPPKGLHVTL